jgi:hypothetical protein
MSYLFCGGPVASTSWSRVILVELMVAQVLKIFPILYGTQAFITSFIKAIHFEYPVDSVHFHNPRAFHEAPLHYYYFLIYTGIEPGPPWWDTHWRWTAARSSGEPTASILYHENGGSRLSWNTDNYLPGYTASHLLRYSESGGRKLVKNIGNHLPY